MSKAEIAEHAYLWIVPFGVGKRMCLGARLAEAEVIAMMARFVQDYEITLAEDSPTPNAVFKMGMIEPWPSPKYVFKPTRLKLERDATKKKNADTNNSKLRGNPGVGGGLIKPDPLELATPELREILGDALRVRVRVRVRA